MNPSMRRRIFCADDKIIARVDAREEPKQADVDEAMEDIQNFLRKLAR